jgi:hypothetical protein
LNFETWKKGLSTKAGETAVDSRYQKKLEQNLRETRDLCDESLKGFAGEIKKFSSKFVT